MVSVHSRFHISGIMGVKSSEGGSTNGCLVILKCGGFCPFPQVQEGAKHPRRGLLLSHHGMEAWLPAEGLALVLGTGTQG